MADEEPQVPEAFKDYIASRGWTFRRLEWNWPYTDEETGESFEGFWSALIYRDEILPSGDVHFRAFDVGAHLYEANPRVWGLLCDVADMEWQHAHEELTLA